MNCQECLEQLHDYLAQELTAEVVATVKAHLEACGPCLERFDFNTRLKQFITRRASHEPLPAGLMERIQAGMAREQVVPRPPKVRALPMTRTHSVLGLAASMVVAVGLTVGLVLAQPHAGATETAPATTAQLMGAQESAEAPVLPELVEDHMTCIHSVKRGDRMTAKEAEAQLTAITGHAVSLPKLPDSMELLSVRNCTINGVQVGHLLLRQNGHIFSWFFMDTNRFPGVASRAEAASEPRTVSSQTCMMRVHQDQTYALISDQPGDVLKQMALAAGF